MGGRGSGRIFRWDKKTSLEECRFIDVRDWKRRGLLADGSGFSWYWMRDGERVADIRVWIAGDRVTVSYRYRRNGGEWRAIAENISLFTTPCHLGGERVFFLCSLIATTDASRKSLSGPAYSKEPVSLFGLNGRFFAPAWAQKGAARRGCQDGPAGPREAAWS